MNLTDQIRRNQLAILSLTVALVALGYNTWRNELSEHNRTVRRAGFEMLVHIAELQRISFLTHYDPQLAEGNPRRGWTEVLLLQDLARLMPADTRTRTDELAVAWAENWERLGSDQRAVDTIDKSIDILRQEVLAGITALD